MKKQVYKVGQTVKVVACVLGIKSHIGGIGKIIEIAEDGAYVVRGVCIASKVELISTLKPKKSKKPVADPIKVKPHYRNTAMGTCVCSNAHVEDLTKPKKSIKKKETKVQELERRIKALEAHRCNPMPQVSYYPNSVPYNPRCNKCGMWLSGLQVHYCP